MAMKHLSVLVPAVLLVEMDALAADLNLNRSEITRLAIWHMLNAPEPYIAPTLPNWQVEAWTSLLRGTFGDDRLVLTADVKVLLVEAVATLNEREVRVLRLRFGLDGPRRTLQETGAIMGWADRERVRQVEAQTLRRLRFGLARSGIWKMLEQQLSEEKMQ